MACLAVWLLAVVLHSGECGSVVTPPRHTARPGESVRMQCSIDTVLLESSLISCYREQPGGVLELVAQFIRHALTTGRYTGEIHNDNGNFSLTIGNVQRSDSGLYFCIVRASGTFTPGRSSRLVVTDPEITPSIQLFSLGSDERESGWTEPVPAVCLVRDASPLWGRVLWTIPGVSAEPGPGRDVVQIGPDGAYTVSSHVTISAEQWESGGVDCRVLNNATGEIFTGRKTNTNTHKDADCFPYLVWRYVLIPGVVVTMWIHKIRSKVGVFKRKDEAMEMHLTEQVLFFI